MAPSESMKTLVPFFRYDYRSSDPNYFLLLDFFDALPVSVSSQLQDYLAERGQRENREG